MDPGPNDLFAPIRIWQNVIDPAKGLGRTGSRSPKVGERLKKIHPETGDFLFAGSGRGLPAEHPEAGTRMREVPLSAPQKLTTK